MKIDRSETMTKANSLPSPAPLRRGVAIAAVSPNEMAWLEFLRLLMEDDVPAPSLARIQALRLAMSSRNSD